MYDFGIPISSACKGMENILYVGLWNGTVSILDYSKKEVIDQIKSSNTEIRSLIYYEGLLYVGSNDTVIKCWNIEVRLDRLKLLRNF